MKLLVLCGLLAVALAASRHDTRWQEVAKPFRAGYEYRYRYESQIASGLGSVHQTSTYRLSSVARIHFDTERVATLRLEDVRIGAQNGELSEPTKMMPFSVIESQDVMPELLSTLEMPLKFDYVDGLVERIYFAPKDTEWSKNVKRAVLNLLQLNMQRRTTNVQGFEFEQFRDEEKTAESRMFTLPEVTLEGECQTVYTLIKGDELTEKESFNVTKTIDFAQCKKVAAIRFGIRDEKPIVNTKSLEVEQTELDRATAIRYQLIGTPEKYAIGHVEVLSQYAYKTTGDETEQPMQTIVLSELTFDEVVSKSFKRVSVSNKEESLLYSIQWDLVEKRFFQFGDEEFTRENTPFVSVQQKSKLAHAIISDILKAMRTPVSITSEVTLKMHQLVEILRMCSVHELEQIYQQHESKEAREIVFDAFSATATRNTIHFLVERAMHQDMTPAKTVHFLQQTTVLPAVSDAQIQQVLRLCKSDVAQEVPAVRQSCWLVVGTLMGQLCKESERASLKESEMMCPRHKKEQYQKLLVGEFKRAENTYDKVLVLKTIGNAALDLCVFDLEKIIVDTREAPLVRMTAIDSLRRLRNQMPRKIQRILLPVFKNGREQPEVRMTAFAMIMHTVPEKAVLDQLTYTLLHERSRHVRTFVISTMKTLIKSPVPVEQELARHLKAIVKTTKIVEETPCLFKRVPIYSESTREGLFLNLAAVFSPVSALPQHLSVSADSFFNGLFKKNGIELSFSQSDIDTLLHRIYENMNGERIFATRSGRLSANSNARKLLETVFDSLKIESRRSMHKTPFGMLCLRLADIDHAMLPIATESMPRAIRQWIEGEQISLPTLFGELAEGIRFRYSGLLTGYERAVKIATSAGLPLRLLHVNPIMAVVEGEMKLRMRTEEQQLMIRARPAVSAVFVQKMEMWSPLINTGVQNVQALDLHLPLDSKLALAVGEEETKVKFTLNLPEEKNRIMNVLSLPVTFIRHFDSKTMLHSELLINPIRSHLHESTRVEMEGETGILRVHGHYYRPSEFTYRAVLSLFKATENHVAIDFVPSSSMPKAIELSMAGKLFKKIDEPLRPTLESFYSSSSKFESLFSEEPQFTLEPEEERHSKLTSFLTNEYRPSKAFEHYAKMSIKTVGGSLNHRAQALLRAICDNTMNFCRLTTEMKRTPMFIDESDNWQLKANAQVLLPTTVRSLEQLSENKQNKFAIAADAHWGCNKMDTVTFKIQGERAVPESLIERRTAFLNKYDLVADYELKRNTLENLRFMFDWIKAEHFWTLHEELIEKIHPGRLFATIMIDPMTRQHMNVSIKTNDELVHFTRILLPFTAQPVHLIREEIRRSIESPLDLVEEISENTRAECRVDGSRVKTFDRVTYKAPIGQCYSVIAKDCANKQFVVLMKSLNEVDKKIKIATSDRVIEVEFMEESFRVLIDGRHITDIDELADSKITVTEDIVRVWLRQGVTVLFNGRQVNVKLSHMYQNTQCGLCGHFDGESMDEFRKNDNEITDDLKTFHRSFSMLKDDDECEVSMHEKLYQNDKLFNAEEERELDYDSEQNDKENFDFSDKTVESKKDVETEEESESEPIKTTKVIEFNDKICFSLKPIKTCRKGFLPEKLEETKVQFACLNRSAAIARRLLREARTKDISTKVAEYKPSLVESVRVAVSCNYF